MMDDWFGVTYMEGRSQLFIRGIGMARHTQLLDDLDDWFGVTYMEGRSQLFIRGIGMARHTQLRRKCHEL